MLGWLKAGVVYLCQWPMAILARVVPVRQRSWGFSSWGGLAFNDNVSALYGYVSENCSDIEPFYICKDRDLTLTLRSRGIRSFYYLSLQGMWAQLRSEVVFFSHKPNREFLAAALWRKNVVLCQLWHGTPLKKIGQSDPDKVRHDKKIYTRLAKYIAPWVDMKWQLMIAPSTSVAKIFERDFLVDDVVVTGYPRLDVARQEKINSSPQKIKKIIYMPTFRGKVGTESSHDAINELMRATGFDVDEIQQFLSDRSLELIIRLHPSNKLSSFYRDAIDRSSCISYQEINTDFYQSIDEYDVLITDYSSVFFDYAVTGRFIIHAGFDVEEYLETSRDMYLQYDDICLTPQVRSWQDILELLDRVRAFGVDDAYLEQYQRLRNWANDDLPCPYSGNVVAEVRRLLEGRV